MATSTIKQPATTIIAKDYSYEYSGFAGGSFLGMVLTCCVVAAGRKDN